MGSCVDACGECMYTSVGVSNGFMQYPQHVHMDDRSLRHTRVESSLRTGIVYNGCTYLMGTKILRLEIENQSERNVKGSGKG